MKIPFSEFLLTETSGIRINQENKTTISGRCFNPLPVTRPNTLKCYVIGRYHTVVEVPGHVET